MHISRKMDVKKPKVRESFGEIKNDTPGKVCIELLNDTLGFVDNDCWALMGDISGEKA